MFQRLFAALENCPSYSQSLPNFEYILWLLSASSSDSTAPLSLRVAREVVVQGIPTVLRKTKSVSLAIALAHGIVGRYWDHFDFSERPFVTIDKIILEMWSEQEGAEGRTEENLQEWKRFRSTAMDWPSSVDLAVLNGPLPTTWNPISTPSTASSTFRRFLSVLGIDWVCGLTFHFASRSDYPYTRVRPAMEVLNHTSSHLRLQARIQVNLDSGRSVCIPAVSVSLSRLLGLIKFPNTTALIIYIQSTSNLYPLRS